jgi:hypothetical protein
LGQFDPKGLPTGNDPYPVVNDPYPVVNAPDPVVNDPDPTGYTVSLNEIFVYLKKFGVSSETPNI